MQTGIRFIRITKYILKKYIKDKNNEKNFDLYDAADGSDSPILSQG